MISEWQVAGCSNSFINQDLNITQSFSPHILSQCAHKRLCTQRCRVSAVLHTSVRHL